MTYEFINFGSYIMMILKTNEQVELMRQSALLVSKTLAEIAKILKPGMTTLAIDNRIGQFVRDHHADPFILRLPRLSF